MRLWVLAAGPILFLGAVHAVFIGSVRYRLPAEYPLLTLAALGLSDLGLFDLGIWNGVFGRSGEGSAAPDLAMKSSLPAAPHSPGRG
mgnify:FL=1